MTQQLILKVRQAAGRQARKSTRIYDLLQDRIVSVEGYQRKIFFSVEAREFEGRLRMSVAGHLLEPRRGFVYPSSNESRFSWNVPGELMGRFGYAENLTALFETSDGEQTSHNVQLQITPGHLGDDELRLLLQDLIYLLYLDWTSSTYTDVISGRDAGFHLPPLAAWNLIRDQGANLLRVVQLIALHPSEALKQVHESQILNPVTRIDTETVRWLAQHSPFIDSAVLSEQSVPTPRDVSTVDTPENRFVVFVLQRITRLLQTLEAALEGQLHEQKRHVTKLTVFEKKPSIKLDRAKKELQQLKQFQEERQGWERRFRAAGQLPSFRSVQYHANAFLPPLDSLVLAQEPRYTQVLDFFLKLQSRVETDWLSQAEGLTRRLTKVGTDRMSTVYETWTFVRTYHELRSMEFSPTDDHDLDSMIIGSRLSPKLASGSNRWIEMTRQLKERGEVTLRLFHEKEFWGKPPLPAERDWAWRPDITIEVSGENLPTRRMFLDAKYKDYSIDDRQFDGLAKLQEDLYGSDLRKVGGVRKYLQIEDAVASFLLHVSTNPEFENYGAQVPRRQNRLDLSVTDPGNHRLGYVPFRPSGTSAFRKLIGMFFVLKLDLDFYCWNCHSDEVVVGTTPNERQCLNCRTTWWRNRCSCSEHPLIIKGDEVPFQEEAHRGNYVCPACGRAGNF